MSSPGPARLVDEGFDYHCVSSTMPYYITQAKLNLDFRLALECILLAIKVHLNSFMTLAFQAKKGK